MEPNCTADNRPPGNSIRAKVYDIIFGHLSGPGLTFDLCLLLAISLSVLLVCIETLPELESYFDLFFFAEVFFTVLFTVEYAVRIWCVQNPWKYIFSFFGLVDLFAILPSLIAIGWCLSEDFSAESFVSGKGSFTVIRSLRLLRVFRILRIGKLEQESGELANAIWKARSKVIVFLCTVMITVVIAGTLMYEIEGTDPKSDFDSIPEGIYWAIVTMTTVGYGDIVPKTVAGKFVSALLILIGYSLIIVPTGFVSAEVISHRAKFRNNLFCPKCQHRGHDTDAKFCKICGQNIESSNK